MFNSIILLLLLLLLLLFLEITHDGRIILEWNLGKQGGKVWTGCIWLKIGTNGGISWLG
jgi:hypothetical protein